MRKIKEMQAEHMYLIRGSSVSNTPFFEHKEDCKLFLALADPYLKDYLTVASFQNNRHGWVMIIATKTESEIKRAYYARRAKSKKCLKKFELKEVWRMLSDQIRIFLSTYVKNTNHHSGRKGAKVRHRYERFVFESEIEALEIKASLESACHPLAQPLERYRPRKYQSKVRDSMIKTCIYMSCAMLSAQEKLVELGMACLDLGVLVTNVARQLIKNTLHHHFPT